MPGNAFVRVGSGYASNPRLTKKLAPPETMVVADQFTRANTAFPPVANNLGKTPLGSFDYLKLSTDGVAPSYAYGGAIVDNAMGLVGESLPGTRRVAVYVNPGFSNARMVFRLVDGVKDSTVAVLFRYQGQNDHLFLTIISNKWCLYKRVGGSGISVFVPNATGYVTNGDVVEIVDNNGMVSYKVNGVEIMPPTAVADFAGQTRYGFGHTLPSGTTSVPLTKFDDFSVSRIGTWTE